jgi:hypothetical protein
MGVAHRDGPHVENGQQGIQAGVRRASAAGWLECEADALAARLGVSLAQLDPLHGERADAGLRQAFATMAVADHALAP